MNFTSSRILEVITLGFYAPPFDRRAYLVENFRINDIDCIEDEPLAIQLRSININMCANDAETTYYARIANRRAVVASLLSILAMLIASIVK